MIAASNVHKWYGRLHALKGVSFELRPGQVAGLLGPNGAGKSTTIRILTGIIPPDAGCASLCGHDTLTRSIAARSVLGYLPESAPSYPEMSVRNFLAYRASIQGIPPRERRAALDRAIERCWLGDVRARPIGQLSKGYRQRVGLAAAILHDPRVLILDEPTNGLDPTQIARMRALVRELGTDRTMLISSHILPEIEQLCSRILIVAGGELRADGSPDELIHAHGQPSRLVVEAAADESALRAALAAACSCRPEEPEITRVDASWLLARAPITQRDERPVESGRDDPRVRLSALLAQRGIPVRELRLHRSSVEDVFVRLTGISAPTPPVPRKEDVA